MIEIVLEMKKINIGIPFLKLLFHFTKIRINRNRNAKIITGSKGTKVPQKRKLIDSLGACRLLISNNFYSPKFLL